MLLGTSEFISSIFWLLSRSIKSHLTLKSQYFETANVVFQNTEVSLTLEGMGHLRAVIGNQIYKEKYVGEFVTNLNNQLQLLSKIAEMSQTQHMQHVLVVLK